MKVTGLILALVGLAGGILCVVALIMPLGPDQHAPPTTGAAAPQLGVVIPLLVCGAAFIIGAALFIFGRRSYFVSNNPRVRN